MVNGWKAGLLALTALATTTPALAQRGEWGGRGGQGGAERQGNPGGGERRAPGGMNPGNGGGWNRGGASVAPGPQAPAPSAPRPQAPSRNWNGGMGGGDRAWQGSTPRTDPRPDQRPDPRPAPVLSGQDRPNWQGGSPNRNGAGFGDRDRGDRNWGNRDRPDNDRGPARGNPGWDNRPGNRPDFARPVMGRPDAGRPGFARPGNGWNDNEGNRGPRLSNSDRWRDQQRWSNNWRRDNRYDWQRYRQVNRDFYRLPAYRAPLGWNYGYSRFSIGVFLGSPLFGSSYWLDDPYSYHLPPAYGTLRWVRYYDDALLVDIRDGYVVDVIHDFFW